MINEVLHKKGASIRPCLRAGRDHVEDPERAAGARGLSGQDGAGVMAYVRAIWQAQLCVAGVGNPPRPDGTELFQSVTDQLSMS